MCICLFWWWGTYGLGGGCAISPWPGTTGMLQKLKHLSGVFQYLFSGEVLHLSQPISAPVSKCKSRWSKLEENVVRLSYFHAFLKKLWCSRPSSKVYVPTWLYAYHVKLRKAYVNSVFTRKLTAKGWSHGLSREHNTLSLAMIFNDFHVFGWSHDLFRQFTTFQFAMLFNTFYVFGWSHAQSTERRTCNSALFFKWIWCVCVFPRPVQRTHKPSHLVIVLDDLMCLGGPTVCSDSATPVIYQCVSMALMLLGCPTTCPENANALI